MAETEKEESQGVNGIGEGEGEKLLDFDMLCASVALQAQNGFSCKENWANFDDDDVQAGGVQRMWEGEVLDCFAHRGIALETTW